MEEALIQQVLRRPFWGAAKLEEAARGKANGACSDPPEVEFEFWLNIAVDRARASGTSVEQTIARIVAQARAGDFG